MSEMRWRDIEAEAPDVDEDAAILVVLRDELELSQWVRVLNPRDAVDDGRATHWMPLPEPPSWHVGTPSPEEALRRCRKVLSADSSRWMHDHVVRYIDRCLEGCGDV